MKCLIAIELKTVEFAPEFAGKMNFYLELLDEQEKQADDNPSIGIILCPIKDNLEVEYALRTSNKPIGVSEYKLTHRLPEKYKGKVPSSKELKQTYILHSKGCYYLQQTFLVELLVLLKSMQQINQEIQQQ